MKPLREITLIGPEVQVGGDKETQPLWTLYAGAPYFGKGNVKPQPGTHADHAHPLRVLSMEAQAVDDGDQSWRRPRLIDLHLVAGKIGKPYEREPSDGVVLQMRFTKVYRNTPFKYLHTVGEPSTLDETRFTRVVAEPVISGKHPWPKPEDKNIAVPPFRIVAGRVPLLVDVKHNPSNLGWLKALGVSPDGNGWCQIWLTPDGIEFDANLPFPGLATGKTLRARVLLAEASDRRGKEAGVVTMVLTHLGPPGDPPDGNAAVAETREENREDWMDAWCAITPLGEGEDERVGLKFAARRSGDVPRFRWAVKIEDGRPIGLVDGIEIPGEALRIELVSPPVDGSIDGVARLRPSWVHASGNAETVMFSMTQRADEQPQHPITVEMTGAVEMTGVPGPGLVVTTAAFHSDINVRRLASDLRSVYRLSTPLRVKNAIGKTEVKAQEAGTPSAGTMVERDRPLLPAFVAVDMGWLQLPVPNLAPLDPGNDLDLATSIPTTPRSVLEGYVRFRSSAASTGVLSGYNQEPVARAESAPWSFTIERATEATLKVMLKPDLAEPPDKRIRQGRLASFEATLAGAKVSARGLLWISSDQPDALDALPRLGAGPGAHMDIALEAVSIKAPEDDKGKPSPPLMGVDVARLKILVPKGESPLLDEAQLELNFAHEHPDWQERLRAPEARAALIDDRSVVLGDRNGSTRPWRPVLWRRHRYLPMVATMPMTRSATASVRPLESRELMPYVMTVGSEPESLLARFNLGGARVFSGLVIDKIQLKPLPGWPLPGDIAKTESGISFTAVGLPGVEVCPLTSVGDDMNLTAAVRYDLPLLDEAFATAPLPPTPNDNAPSELLTPPPRPPATAVDWPLLRDFWDAQNRTHQNARVCDSYLSTFLNVDTDKPHTFKVGNLIDGLTWATTIHVQTHVLAQRLPYGTLTIGNKTMSGNAALEDHERGFSVDVARATLTEGGHHITVVGFSPPTFREEKNGALLDNRRVGAGAAEITANDALLMRPVTLPAQPAGARLVSLMQPITIQMSGPSATSMTLAFWFKDVLVDRNGKADLREEEELPFQIWKQADELAAGGFEWRLAPVEQPFAEAAFRDGRDAFSLFGFVLEPLRLTSLNVKDDLISEAKIVCRLTLGPRQEAAKGNVVVLKLVQAAGSTTCTFEKADEKDELRFPFEAWHQGQVRALVLHATLAEGEELRLSSPKLDVMVAGRMITCAIVDTSFERIPEGNEHVDRLKITAETSAPKEKSGAFLYLPKVEVEIKQTYEYLPKVEVGNQKSEVQTIVRKEHPPTFLNLEQIVLIHPWPALHPPKPDRKPLQIASSGKEVDFFGPKWTPETMNWKEGVGVLEVDGFGEWCGLIHGLAGRLAFGLLARVESIEPRNESNEGHLLLVAGHLEADFRQKAEESDDKAAVSLTDTQLRLVASTPTFDPDHPSTSKSWNGVIEVTTRVKASSRIEWPALKWEKHAEHIPVPEQEHNGRARITAETGNEVTRHSVEWIIAGHSLPLTLAADIAARQPDAVWTLPVWARHTLVRGVWVEDTLVHHERTLRWNGLDTLGFGASVAIVPRFESYDADAHTFAARYAHVIKKDGKYDKNKREPGMDYAGRGALAKVLHGLQGKAFREHFWRDGVERPEWLLAGGHLGVLGLDRRGDTGVLVRLPALVGLDEKFPQAAPAEGFDVAWADGPAALRVARSRPNMATPASAAYDAILAALRSAHRVQEETEIHELIAAALLVDQAMQHRHAGDSSASPHFVASAIDIERLHNFTSFDKPEDTISLASLSLIAVDLRGPKTSTSFAAAISMRDGNASIPSPVRSPRVVTLGRHVAEDFWQGNIDDPMGLAKLLYGIAVARHATPLGAMVMDDRNGEAKFVVMMFPGSGALATAITADFRVGFADHGRGPLAVPTDAGKIDRQRRWLLPPIEGATTPVRDVATPADAGDSLPSGLAGVSTRVALATHAGHAVNSGDKGADPDLIWISQTRVPIYLPLKITDMRGPPIAWLTPAPPRVRLPVATEVIAALEPPSEDGSPKLYREIQPYLPPTLTTTALSERAGIRTVRRMRLLAALRNGIGAFDAEITRFGRPAQAGSSFARTMRSPRPGRLPVNLDNPARDRRVQASGLNPLTGCAAFIGSADVLEGTYSGIGRWSIVLVAAPEWESVVSDRWDGSIRLAFRVSLKRDPWKLDKDGKPEERKEPPNPRALVMKALFPELVQTPPRRARAALKIGNVRIDYNWLQVNGDPVWLPGEGIVYADLLLMLDLRNGGLPRPHPAPALPAIIDALSTLGPLPPVELQLTLRPSNPMAAEEGVNESAINNDIDDGFALATDEASALTPGSDRAPLTLRFPLYPITAQRGALPLTPATLLFRDRAYDRDLAGPPNEDARLAMKPTNLQPDRGGLRIVLAVDRASVNRRGTLVLLADVRYERPMSDLQQWKAEHNDEKKRVGAGGDLLLVQAEGQAKPSLTVSVQSRDGEKRDLGLPEKKVDIAWGVIHELALTQLLEEDGQPARLAAGDMLLFEMEVAREAAVTLWNSISKSPQDVILDEKVVGRNLRVMLTDDPIVEPPSALYLALMRTLDAGKQARLSVPLHAQSPLPSRVDFADPLRDFRKGMIRREAVFVWTLLRPTREFLEKSLNVAVVKCDRNGQLYLPDEVHEFTKPERLP